MQLKVTERSQSSFGLFFDYIPFKMNIFTSALLTLALVAPGLAGMHMGQVYFAAMNLS